MGAAATLLGRDPRGVQVAALGEVVPMGVLSQTRMPGFARADSPAPTQVFRKGNTMHQNRLDDVTRALRRGVSRRSVLTRCAVAGALGTLAATRGITAALALSEPVSAGSTTKGGV